jgi:hypothetical protein
MINVNQITSYLSKLQPDSALQRYAMMHKDDPYIVSLALAESNRRKDTRMGAQMTTPQQPKVADQAIQGMAAVDPMGNYAGTPMPETVGIGQLPAKNLAKMAGGGIVAFADGGETDDDYMYPPGEVVARMADGGMVPRYQTGGVMGDIPGFISTGRPFVPQPGYPESQTYLARKMDELVDKVQRGIASPQEKAWVSLFGDAAKQRVQARQQTEPLLAPATPTAPSAPSAPRTAPTAADLGPVPGSDARSVLGGAPVGASPTPAPTPERAQPPAPTTGRPPATAGLALTPEAVKEEMTKMGVTSGVPQEITSGIEALRKTQEDLAKRNLSDIEAEQKARGPAMAAFEKRLKDKEGRLSKEEGTLGPLALLQAGLSIMSGTSPFGLSNIGAGATVGLKAYTEGVDKLERARDKIDEAFAKIEEVRRNEGRMDAKELRDAKNSINQVEVEAKKLGLSALEKNWGFNRQDATKGLELLFQNRRTAVEQEGLDRRTGMEISARKEIAGMPTADVRTYEALGAAAPGSAIRTGFDLAKIAAMRERATETWSKLAYPAGGLPNEAFLRRYPTPQAYAEEALQQAAGGGGGSGGTPAIRTR